MPTDPARALGKMVLIVGLLLVALGLLLSFGNKLPFRLGRLPGDIIIKRDGFTFYFPLATSIVVSIILTLLFTFLRRRP
jgi:hypothetical protein